MRPLASGAGNFLGRLLQFQTARSDYLSSRVAWPATQRRSDSTKAPTSSFELVAMAAKAKGAPSVKRGPEPTYGKPSSVQVLQHNTAFETSWGEKIDDLQVAYESWGTLNETRSNAILLQGGLSASSHARSTLLDPSPGWWEKFVGPGSAIDTDRFFVVCCNNLGSCFGTSGPSSFCPATGRPYGLRFPFISVLDMVRSQMLVLDALKIKKLHGVVGSSLGGMMSLTTAAFFPDRVGRVITISAALESHPMSIAIRFAQRQALFGDVAFNGGDYYDTQLVPSQGLGLARQIATIAYRSGPEWEKRFGRKRAAAEKNVVSRPSFDPEFEIERYVVHQGAKWCKVFDPNSMLYISKAMDLFSLKSPTEASTHHGESSQEGALKNITMPCLVMGVQSDVLFPVWQQREIAQTLRSKVGNKHVVYYELDSIYGHDTFLIDVTTVGAAVRGHLEAQFK